MKTETAAGVLVGIGIGIVLGSLFAPYSGERTRHLLNKKLKNGFREVKQNADDFMESASDVLDRGRAELARQQFGVTDAVAAGKKAYQRVVG